MTNKVSTWMEFTLHRGLDITHQWTAQQGYQWFSDAVKEQTSKTGEEGPVVEQGKPAQEEII